MTWQTYKNTGKSLPKQPFNLRSLFRDIENQGVLGACTAFATLQCFAVMRCKQGYPWQIFSQLAEWYMSRELYGEEINNPNWVNENKGVMEDNALQVLIDDGVVSQADDPWNTQVMIGNWVKAYQTEPPAGDWVSSIKLKPSEVFQISTSDANQSLLDVRDALASGYPVLLSTLVFDNWFNCGDVIPDTKPGTQNAAGGHEINIIGDDPVNQRLLILNQWSDSWGIQFPANLAGCAWLPYDYFKNYTQELFVLIPDASAPPVPTPKPTPGPAPIPTPKPQPSTKYINGGDVSKFQGSVNWPDAAKSWSFAMVKCLDGKTPIDPDFATNYANAQSVGIIRGAYQVGYPVYDTATASFATFAKAVEAQGGFELPPILDIEGAGCGKLDVPTVTAWVNAWISVARKYGGRAPIIYSDVDFLSTRLDLSKLPSDVLIWAASYSSTAPTLPDGRKWTFWQYTDASSITGISPKTDSDYFNGTKGDLVKLSTKSAPTVTATPMHAQINGKEVDAYDIGGKTYVIWAAIPGVKAEKTSAGEWNFVTIAVDEKPISITLTYADGSTQTTKL